MATASPLGRLSSELRIDEPVRQPAAGDVSLEMYDYLPRR